VKSRARQSLKLACKKFELLQSTLQRTHYSPARTRKKAPPDFGPSGAHSFSRRLRV
jgi:hypothetical protein